MKKVGVLGCTGEIGKRIVELLQKNYSVKAGFHKVNPDKMWSSVEYSQFDIHDRKRLTFYPRVLHCYKLCRSLLYRWNVCGSNLFGYWGYLY